jgi:hypothetical protein
LNQPAERSGQPDCLCREGEALDIAHEAEIDALLARLRAGSGDACLSDFAFSNLYLFRRAHAYRYLPGRYPCVAGLTYDGVRHLFPLFDLAAAPLPALRERLEGYDCFFPVAERAAQRLSPEQFMLAASPDDADYLYPAENFRSYRGELLRKKRQLMQQLLDSAEVRAYPLTPARIEDASAVHACWLRDKGKAQGEADDAACRDALQLFERFGLDGMVYYARGEAIGFLLAQRLAPSLAVMRFAKGVDAYKGIYQYMFHQYCVARPDIAWINFEQDLGLSNFRQTKRSYQPAAMLAKYRVRMRPEA